MIQLTAEITIFAEQNGTITEISDYIETQLGERISPNNVSCKLSEVLGKTKHTSNNPFIIGVSKIGDNSTLSSDKVDYFIGDILSDENGVFRDKYGRKAHFNIELKGDIKSATILFDLENGGHPKTMSVDNTDFFDDDPIFTISDTTTVDFWDETVDTHTIRISEWNKPNRPLIIQGIYITPQTVKIDRSNTLSLESSITDRSDIKLPSWGIISNGGRIEFKDTNGEIKDYAEQGFLQEGLPCKIYLKDTISKFKQAVGSFYTTNWEYDYEKKTATTTLSDALLELQNTNSGEILSEVNDTIKSILDGVYLSTNFKIDSETVTHLTNTKVPFRYLHSGSKWSKLQEICTAAQCYIYADKNGDIIMKYINGE